MSFLEALKEQKKILKTTNTLVKTPGGDVFLEKRNEAGCVNLEKVACSAGYIIDLQPDLQVANVLPGLFMASQDVAQDVSLLQEHGIKQILSIGVEVQQIPGLRYKFIEVLDLPEFDMNSVFEESTQLINEVREVGEAVLVHCNAGVSRSAAVVIAYLMRCNKLRYQEAFDVLKQVRPCIKPNEGFVKQLKLFEERLFVDK